MAKQGDTIRISLTEDRAVALLWRVKPTKDMPRPGAHAMKAKKRKTKAKVLRAKGETVRLRNMQTDAMKNSGLSRLK